MDIPPLPPEFFTDEGDMAHFNRAENYLLNVVFKGPHQGDEHEDEIVRALPTPLADLWILGWLEYETIQGGLHTYFINRHGRRAAQAVEAFRRCGAEELARVLDEARVVVTRHEAAWKARNEELDAKGEYAVVRPFQDLAGLDELGPVADRFEHLLDQNKPHWRSLMNDRLERFRDELVDKRQEGEKDPKMIESIRPPRTPALAAVPAALVAFVLVPGCASSATRPVAPSRVTGRLPPEDIQREVRRRYLVFQACYEDGLRRSSQLKGRVAVRFVIQRDGWARDVQFGGLDMPDPDVVSCIVEGFKSLRFPPPEGGTVTVTYPLRFDMETPAEGH